MEIGANAGQPTLHLRMQGGRVFVRPDDFPNASEDEAGSSLERFGLQLPDTIHQDIAGAYARPNHAAAALFSALHGDRLSYIADQDAIELEVLGPQKFLQVMEHADAQVVEDTSIREG